MNKYTTDICVTVYPFTRQPDEHEVVIGRLDTTMFLVLPYDAVELLDYLAAGKTVGEAQSLYQQKYGEVPDMEDFLDFLESKGFVYPQAREGQTTQTSIMQAGKVSQIDSVIPTPAPRNFHFTNFPQSWAKRLFSRPLLISYGILIALALVAIIFEPSLIPGWNAYFFTENMTLMRLSLMVLGSFTVFFHEMAHLLAAHAVGVSSRFSISNRLWILVAETDMTGIWAIPRKQRYLPLLAGSLIDAVSASVIILVFFAQNQGWLVLDLIVFQLCAALLLNYLLNLLWQCYFFVRTDFYYVIANLFRCKSLMKDTEVFLRNHLARIVRSIRPEDQSHIPSPEIRVIRYYAFFWLIGRIAAFGTLIFISIPLTWQYLTFFVDLITEYKTNFYALIDGFFMVSISFIYRSIGFWLWIRGLVTARKLTHG